MTQPSTPSPDAAGPTPTDNRVYHCICEADGKGHLPACVLANTTATSAIPIVAASPEGSAGLDAGKLIESLTKTAAWFEACANRDPIPSASLLAEAASWRALASALPSLIDAERCPWCAGSGAVPIGGWPDVNGYEREGPCPCGDGTAAGAFRRLEAQLADARSQLEAEKETRLEDLADQRKEWERANAAEDQVESLRSSREQAIAAIEALPTRSRQQIAPGVELSDDYPADRGRVVPKISIQTVDLDAVLSILRGSNG